MHAVSRTVTQQLTHSTTEQTLENGCVASAIQLCLTLCGPLNCSPSNSFVHGIFQARILEWLFPSPGDLLDPGIKPTSPVSPALQADSLPPSHKGSPKEWIDQVFSFFQLLSTEPLLSP